MPRLQKADRKVRENHSSARIVNPRKKRELGEGTLSILSTSTEMSEVLGL